MALPDLLAKLAQHIGTETLALADNGALTIEFDDRLVVSIEADHEEAVLCTLTASLGSVPPTDSATLFRQALEFNLLSASSGGPTIGLLEGQDQLGLVQPLSAAIDPELFLETLDIFLDHLADWQSRLSLMTRGSDSPTEALPGEMMKV